jgi:hypothetical protein
MLRSSFFGCAMGDGMNRAVVHPYVMEALNTNQPQQGERNE